MYTTSEEVTDLQESVETIEEGEWFGGLKKKFNAASDAYNNSRGVPSPRQAQGGGSKPSITVKQTKSAEKTTPYSKTDSGKLTDFGAGGGKEKMRRTGMSAHEVEQLGRANTGKRLPQIDDHSKYHKNSFEPEGETISEMDERSPEYNRKKQEAAKKAHHDKKKQTPITAGGGAPEESGQVDRYRQMARERARKNQNNMESADLFDLMKGYLLDEGHADTEEDAMYIMANMTEESRQEIIDFIIVEQMRGDLESPDYKDAKRVMNTGKGKEKGGYKGDKPGYDPLTGLRLKGV